MGCGSSKQETKTNKSNDFFYCFNKEEISLINEIKEKTEENIKNGGDEEKDKIKTIYQKIELDLLKKEKTFTDYLVLYIPNNYSQISPIKYEYSPVFGDLNIEVKEKAEYIKYDKINNVSKNIQNFKCIQDKNDCTEFPSPNRYSFISLIEFTVPQKDLEKNLIIIEACYNIKFKPSYGLYNIDFLQDCAASPLSLSLFIDENFKMDYSDREQFKKLSKNEYFLFNQSYIPTIPLRDKRVKIDIKNELSKELLSKFSSEEIKQINFSLNEMEIRVNCDNLIYHKAIHNIKNNKNYIKLYYVIFAPVITNKSGQGSEGGGNREPIIIKKFTINNTLLNNARENPENNGEDKNVYGYYISSPDELDFHYLFKETFALFELECESNESVDFFRLDCSEFLSGQRFVYGSSFKYEIILNGNKIKFSNDNIKYKINKDKIIFEGYLDHNKENYNEEQYIKMKKEGDEDFDINDMSMNSRLYDWEYLRKKELIPFKMNLI